MVMVKGYSDEEAVNGDGKASNGDGKPVKGDEEALNCTDFFRPPSLDFGFFLI